MYLPGFPGPFNHGLDHIWYYTNHSELSSDLQAGIISVQDQKGTRLTDTNVDENYTSGTSVQFLDFNYSLYQNKTPAKHRDFSAKTESLKETV